MLVAATVVAQDKPGFSDFSGHWILEASADAGPDVARSLTVRQPIVRANVFGAPMPPASLTLSVEWQFDADVRSETYHIGTGGVVGGIPANSGTFPAVAAPQTRFSVRWEDSRLVVETGRYAGPTRESGPYTEHAEVWQLDAAGRLVISMTDRGSGIAWTTKTLTYRKN